MPPCRAGARDAALGLPARETGCCHELATASTAAKSPTAFNRMGFVGCTEPAGMQPRRCMGHQVGGIVISRRAKGQNQGVKAPGPSAPSTGRKISQLTFYVKLIQKLISSTGRIIGFHSGAGPDGQCAESQTHLISTETMPEDRNKTHKDNY